MTPQQYALSEIEKFDSRLHTLQECPPFIKKIKQILSTPTDVRSMEEILSKFTGIDARWLSTAKQQAHIYPVNIFKAMSDYAQQQTATITQELAEARREIERLKEFEWMYNDLSK